MTLWIPGVKGLVGAALAREVDAMGTGRELDIADPGAVDAFVQRNQVTQIINCAAFSLVDAAEVQRDEAFRTNVLGPATLARVAKERGAHLIHLSTDYVFPGTFHRPLKEDDAVGPCNYYGETKLEGERRVLQENPAACILRTSWVFGSGGKNLITRLLALLQEREELQLVNDQWGRFTYAVDLVQVLLRMRGKSGLYQFANAGVATKFSFASFLYETLTALHVPMATKRILSVPSATFPSPCKRPQYSAFDTTKIEQQLGLCIRPWQEALHAFLRTL